jgi:hypothetical protein
VPRLSILVPLSGPITPFETTLASVLQNRPADCDVLVVHPESYDDPWSLSNEVQFLEAPEGTPLLEMLDASLPYVRGDVVHLVAGGVEVTEGWADAALAEFRHPKVASVSPVIIDSSNPQQIAGLGVGYKTGGRRFVVGAGQPRGTASAKSQLAKNELAKPLGPTMRAGFYRTDLLEQLGGWETSVGDHWADVDLALSLSHAGYECVIAERSVLQGPPEDSLPRTMEQAKCAERVFWRHAAHRGWLSSLIAHPISVALQSLGELPSPSVITQCVGRLMALTEGARYSEFREELGRWVEMQAQQMRAASTASRTEQGNAAVGVPSSSVSRPEATNTTGNRKAA